MRESLPATITLAKSAKAGPTLALLLDNQILLKV
jgi:hypothetical protein